MPTQRRGYAIRLLPITLILLALAGCQQFGGPPAVPVPPPVIVRHVNDTGDAFEVTGAAPAVLRSLAAPAVARETWTALFTVTANDNLEPMLGTYSVEAGVIKFRPRWPLVPGVRYTATFHTGKQPGGPITGGPIVGAYTPPKPEPPPPARVAAVFPSADRLPENLLRVYLHFSGPMRRGDVYDHIRLLGPDDKPVESPFVTLGEELWNEEGTRLTLLLDPGRQKHGLLPRQQAGPVLEAGKSYALVIGGGWQDAHGRPLGREYRKRFAAVAVEARPIQPADWNLAAPPPGTREPLTVTFDRSLDHALLRRVVTVADKTGEAVEGEVTIADAETVWRFVPRQPWAAGEFALVVEQVLEDVCGNRVGRAFEVDEDRTEPRPAAAVRRLFVVTAK